MKKLTSIAAFAALTAFAGAASAQAYVGGTVGFSNFSVDCPSFNNCDKQDTAFKVYGGFTLAPHWAIEAAYIDFGSTTATVGPVRTYNVDTSAFIVNGAYRWDFSPKWAGVARLGLASVNSDLASIVGSDSDSPIKLYAGLGIEYAVAKNIKIVGALDLTAFEVGGSDGSLNAVSGGIQFSF
ncbi:MAG: porin family protein [Pseudomonas sp.]|uniref:outer membrane beta-barrel protein n=1 Tax=Pseudomonas sp. TaxID=306 RepID=UPI001203EA25|nr:outer membrane beta-barrel protein [Pseudomonas sp.]RZI74184.1 MAG: porin family protein [Pseudomonas sp.]